MSRLRITNYVRPRVEKDFNPLEVNDIWKLICRLADIQHDEMLAALKAAGVEVSLNRVKGWKSGVNSEHFSALNIAELKRNLEALIAYDRAQGRPGPDEAD